MILGLMLGATWWQVVIGYFAVGIIWGVLYLPRSITRQARAYVKWRDDMTENTPLAEVFNDKVKSHSLNLSPEKFRQWRDARRFGERAIILGFMLSIAFWPMKVVEAFVADLIQAALRWLGELLVDFWNKVVVRLCRAVWRLLKHIWRHVLVPVYRWLYDRVVSVYQAIIQRTNREALADMEILNNVSLEKK